MNNLEVITYGQTIDLQTIEPGDTLKCQVPEYQICSPPVCEYVSVFNEMLGERFLICTENRNVQNFIGYPECYLIQIWIWKCQFCNFKSVFICVTLKNAAVSYEHVRIRWLSAVVPNLFKSLESLLCLNLQNLRKVEAAREIHCSLFDLEVQTNRRISCLCCFPTDAPKTPTVSSNPSYNILEGDRVTLKCRSDANPQTSYSWFKGNQTLHHNQPELIIQSVQSSDAREYSCRAENLLGESTKNIKIDVKCEDLNCVQPSYLTPESNMRWNLL